MPGATSATQQNEQSMVLKVINLESGDARAAFKNVNMDMEITRKLKCIHMLKPLQNMCQRMMI